MNLLRRFRWDRILVLIIAIALWLPIIASLSSCPWFERAATKAATDIVTPEAPPPAVSGNTKSDEASLEAARKRQDADLRKTEEDAATIARLEKAVAQDQDRDLQRRFAWVAGASLFAVLACAALCFILPAGARSLAAWAGIACVAVSGLSLVMRSLVPYRYAIGWLIVSGMIIFLIWKLGRWIKTAKASAAHGDMLEQAVLAWDGSGKLADVVSDVKKQSARIQDSKGVRDLVAAVRGRPKPAKVAA